MTAAPSSPEAHVAFLDEVFKANSAILNALLTVANERTFFNDGRPTKVPLISLVGASNELPEGSELEALFDRFLLRYWVPYLTESRSLHALLSTQRPVSPATITLAGLELCSAEAMQVTAPDEVVVGVIAIKRKTEEQGFRSSDRRWRQVIDLLRARAYLEGDDVVSEDHLDVLPDCLWREPKDRPALAAIVGSIGNPANVRATEVLDAAKEAVGQLGVPDTKDAGAKADWLRTASLIESRLSAMEQELTTLTQQNAKRNLRRVKEVLGALNQMKTDVTRRVASLYRL